MARDVLLRDVAGICKLRKMTSKKRIHPCIDDNNNNNNMFFLCHFQASPLVCLILQYRLWEYTLGSFGGDPGVSDLLPSDRHMLLYP